MYRGSVQETKMEIQCRPNAMFLAMFLIGATSAVFQDMVCGENAMTCANGECIRAAQECDGQFDCADGSDEQLVRCRDSGRPLWPIIFHCSVEWTRDEYPDVCPSVCAHIPGVCAYALLAEAGAPGTCRLPPYPENGSYRIEDQLKTDTFSLYYTCGEDYDLEGVNYPRCEDGTWLNAHPTCKLFTGPWYIREEDVRK